MFLHTNFWHCSSLKTTNYSSSLASSCSFALIWSSLFWEHLRLMLVEALRIQCNSDLSTLILRQFCVMHTTEKVAKTEAQPQD